MKYPVAFALSAAMTLASGQDKGMTIEEVATIIAAQHNANSEALLDEMTLATSAAAKGKNVRFAYMMKVKPNLTDAQRAAWRAGIFADVVPRICKANAQNVAFQRGLYYTLIYLDSLGNVAVTIDVTKQTCELSK